jgi:choline dehydrogenase
LRPETRRGNLTIVTDAVVHRIVIERKHAVGVSFHHAGHQMTASSEGQIVLTAGSIGSPQLLMLSGLGPAQHLRGLGIDVVADLPGVGANLQDHPTLPMIWKTRNSTDVVALAQDPRALITFQDHQPGPLTPRCAMSVVSYPPTVMPLFRTSRSTPRQWLLPTG